MSLNALNEGFMMDILTIFCAFVNRKDAANNAIVLRRMQYANFYAQYLMHDVERANSEEFGNAKIWIIYIQYFIKSLYTIFNDILEFRVINSYFYHCSHDSKIRFNNYFSNYSNILFAHSAPLQKNLYLKFIQCNLDINHFK